MPKRTLHALAPAELAGTPEDGMVLATLAILSKLSLSSMTWVGSAPLPLWVKPLGPPTVVKCVTEFVPLARW